MDKMSYHPNYFQQGGAVRNGCQQRLELIKKHTQGGSLLDIGCSEGFYSFGLSDRCKPIMAIDKELLLVQACRKIKGSHDVNIDFRHMNIDELLQLTETWNICLYMSVHHHIIAQCGMEVANDILRTLSQRCDCMFFDVGQKNEQNCTMHKWWQLLPPNTDQEAWLSEYLSDNTVYAHCQLIGSSRIHNVGRLLWKLTK
jgi:hypothetical protein